MPVTTKTAKGAAAKTEYQTQFSPRARRRRVRRRNAKMLKALFCVIVAGCSLGYVGTYAQVARCGYHKWDLQSKIRQAEATNQSLTGDIQMLSSPARLSAAAAAAGMQQSSATMFIGSPRTAKVAKAY
jgi:cell division protein FtsL